LTQKHILLTGASRGIGLALAEQCAQRKAHLHLVSRKLDPSLVAELGALGAASVTLWPFDVRFHRFDHLNFTKFDHPLRWLADRRDAG